MGSNDEARRLLAILPKQGNVLITSHENPDPDALAASLALQTILKEKTDLNPKIAIGGILGRAENRALTLELELDLHPLDILQHQIWDAVLMVDAQPGAGNANLPRTMPIQAVIDHHPRRHTLRAPFLDIRPNYGAVSTILVEYLQNLKININTRLATALFYAIKSETQDLGRGVCEADRQAHFDLFDSVDWSLLHRVVKAKIPGDYFNVFKRGIDSARKYGNALIANLGEIPSPDAVAEIADFLLRHENITRTMVMGVYEDQLVFSIRFLWGDGNAGIVAAKMARTYGAGGGHEQMAGGRILLNKVRAKRLGNICQTLTRRFLELTGVDQISAGEPLLPANS